MNILHYPLCSNNSLQATSWDSITLSPLPRKKQNKGRTLSTPCLQLFRRNTASFILKIIRKKYRYTHKYRSSKSYLLEDSFKKSIWLFPQTLKSYFYKFFKFTQNKTQIYIGWLCCNIYYWCNKVIYRCKKTKTS